MANPTVKPSRPRLTSPSCEQYTLKRSLLPSTAFAHQVLTGIVDQMKPEDSLGVVLFSDGACSPRALSSMKGADVAELKRRVGGWLVGGAE